jgi:hypothetical protein
VGEKTAVQEVDGFEDDEGADESGFGGVVVGVEDGRQVRRKTVLNKTERKVRTRPYANCLATRDEVGDPEVLGKLTVLGDDANMVDGGEPEGLDSGEQWGMVNKGRDRGDLDWETGSYFIPRSKLGTTGGMDAYILVGVFVVLVNARRVREDDGGRNVLLIVEMRERRQGTG